MSYGQDAALVFSTKYQTVVAKLAKINMYGKGLEDDILLQLDAHHHKQNVERANFLGLK